MCVLFGEILNCVKNWLVSIYWICLIFDWKIFGIVVLMYRIEIMLRFSLVMVFYILYFLFIFKYEVERMNKWSIRNLNLEIIKSIVKRWEFDRGSWKLLFFFVCWGYGIKLCVLI